MAMVVVVEEEAERKQTKVVRRDGRWMLLVLKVPYSRLAAVSSERRPGSSGGR